MSFFRSAVDSAETARGRIRKRRRSPCSSSGVHVASSTVESEVTTPIHASQPSAKRGRYKEGRRVLVQAASQCKTSATRSRPTVCDEEFEAKQPKWRKKAPKYATPSDPSNVVQEM